MVCIALLDLLTMSANAQANRKYRFTSDPVKLAQKITRGDTSDQQKVTSIYTWVTYNIRYDAKRFYRWDTDNQDVQTALRRRKTLCTGISDVVREMCIASGIQAVTVNGYVKTLDYDIGDTTYLPTHAWNKIRINGEWLNADATWDLGSFALYKTSKWRRFWSQMTFGLVSPYTFNPEVRKNPTMRYFLKDDNCFAVDHLPENPNLQNFLTPMLAMEFDEDSAAYYWKDSLMQLKNQSTNDYLNQYAGLERLQQDKLDGKKASDANERNQWGMTRYHHYELVEKWENYLSNEALKYDSVVLKELIRTADSTLFYSDFNRHRIAHEQEVLLQKHRKKISIQKAYNSDYRRYLKSIRHQRTTIKMALRKSKHQLKRKKAKTNNELTDLRLDHWQKAKWSDRPTGRGVDSLSGVFRTYTDSLRHNEEKVRALMELITDQTDTIRSKSLGQLGYIDSLTNHFTNLIYYRIYAQDDYDYWIVQEKQQFLYHETFDSILGYGHACDSLKTLTDSMYRLVKTSFRLLKRQESLLRRIKRKTINRGSYYALNEQFINNMKLFRYDMNRWMSHGIDKLEESYEITDGSTPVKEAQSVVRFERKIHLGTSFIRGKAKWHHRRNNMLYKFARRVRTRALAKLEFSRIKAEEER
jgi:hypothetical protein